MRVALMTAGSRGDVAPFAGLGHGLARAGHEVTVVTHESFAGLVREAGLAFRGLPVDPRAELESEDGRRLLTIRSGPRRLAAMLAMARRLAGELAPGMVAAARTSDVLLLAGSVAPLGRVIGDALGLPSRDLHLQPLAPTRAFPPSVLGVRSLGGAGNRLAARAVDASLELVFARAAREVRGELGGARGRSGARRERPVHHGFSSLVVPRPPDWRPGLSIDGYWWSYTSADAELPELLRDFLDAGPPPVFVGLGSLTVAEPERVSGLVVRALRAAGLRGVIQAGWSGLHAEGDDMLSIGEVPHSLLFPRVAAVVHHGGAGTTAAGLRAGVPAVPLPMWFDAAFWAARLVAVGVSPGPVPLSRFTSPQPLAEALTAATRDPAYRRRAAALAERLRREDGVARLRAALDGLSRDGCDGRDERDGHGRRDGRDDLDGGDGHNRRDGQVVLDGRDGQGGPDDSDDPDDHGGYGGRRVRR
ncbi:glycosyltransferase [Streptomyces sp. NPDC053431]|uniref:glycosyltransferase n=1 Tax=Streptomyces sp. NPDC053431 TaxID=3365703 RepID=UPI0037D776BC